MTFESITNLLKHPAQAENSAESKLITPISTETSNQLPQTANDRRERRIKLAQLTTTNN